MFLTNQINCILIPKTNTQKLPEKESTDIKSKICYEDWPAAARYGTVYIL